MNKFYAIKVGNTVNDIIVHDWEECKKYVIGYPAIYKSFKTKKEAKTYLKELNNSEVLKRLEIAEMHKIKKLKKKLQEKFDFFIPDYILQEIVQNSNISELVELIDFAVLNEHISLKNAILLKNNLQKIYKK